MNKNIKIILTSLIMAFSSIAVATDDNYQIITTCEHKYDKKLKFTYNINDLEIIKPLDYNVIIYVITDVNGKSWVLNHYEKENYICTEEKTDKYSESYEDLEDEA